MNRGVIRFEADAAGIAALKADAEPKAALAIPVMAIHAINDPQVSVNAEAFYRDHYAYTEKDVRELLLLKQRSEADGFVTTEKDAVNLGPYLSTLEPLCVVPVQIKLADPANALQSILRKIDERNHAA